MLFVVLAALVAWGVLLFWRGQFWKADQVLPAAAEPSHWPSVTVIIPARDEAETIREVASAHRTADYPGELAVVVADDQSSDGTAEEALAAPGKNPLSVVRVGALPEGWSGKLWALETGLRSLESEPDYILFTDADILPGPGLVRKLVAEAEKEDLALTSIMARLDDRGFWSGLLVPAFIFFFQKLYPFPWVNDPEHRVAGAAGGVMLVRREALDKIGGLEALRGVLIDDCTLAQRIKNTPPRSRIGLYLSSGFAEATSLRDNRSYEAMKNMVARSAYSQLGYNPWALVGTILGMIFLYIVGPAVYVTSIFREGTSGVLAAFAVLILMVYAYQPTLKRYGRPWWQGIGLPLAALFYAWFTWLSAWRHWQGRGGQWKGRSYPASKPS